MSTVYCWEEDHVDIYHQCHALQKPAPSWECLCHGETWKEITNSMIEKLKECAVLPNPRILMSWMESLTCTCKAHNAISVPLQFRQMCGTNAPPDIRETKKWDMVNFFHNLFNQLSMVQNSKNEISLIFKCLMEVKAGILKTIERHLEGDENAYKFLHIIKHYLLKPYKRTFYVEVPSAKWPDFFNKKMFEMLSNKHNCEIYLDVKHEEIVSGKLGFFIEASCASDFNKVKMVIERRAMSVLTGIVDEFPIDDEKVDASKKNEETKNEEQSQQDHDQSKANTQANQTQRNAETQTSENQQGVVAQTQQKIENQATENQQKTEQKETNTEKIDQGTIQQTQKEQNHPEDLGGEQGIHNNNTEMTNQEGMQINGNKIETAPLTIEQTSVTLFVAEPHEVQVVTHDANKTDDSGVSSDSGPSLADETSTDAHVFQNGKDQLAETHYDHMSTSANKEHAASQNEDSVPTTNKIAAEEVRLKEELVVGNVPKNGIPDKAVSKYGQDHHNHVAVENAMLAEVQRQNSALEEEITNMKLQVYHKLLASDWS